MDNNLGTHTITLAELRARPATLEELQAIVIRLIDLHNKLVLALQKELAEKLDRQFRAIL